jgi:septation ring formation regulator EzrA
MAILAMPKGSMGALAEKASSSGRRYNSCCIGLYDDGRLAVPEMTDLEPSPERFDRIEHKLDALSESVDRRFDEVNERFDEVSEHFVEQRQYTKFAFEKLRGETLTGFRRIEGRLDRFERKLDGFETRLDGFETRLDGFERKLDGFETKLERFESEFDRFESKFDEFVKSQARPPRRQRIRRVQKKR